MGDAIVHRGPDDSGALADGELLLGMRRLSIIDVSGGHQPIASEDGQVVAVCNGEIYNFRELRRDSRGCGPSVRDPQRFAKSSCTPTRSTATRSLSKLDGMFGLALWDRRRRRLIVARDAIGIKPIYYRLDGRELMFASEAKAILAVPGVSGATRPGGARPVPIGGLCLRAQLDLRGHAASSSPARR